MKRIANTLKDIIGIAAIVAIIGLTVLSATNAAAQDLYLIEQQVDDQRTVDQLTIHSGWDAHLIQTPAGTPTRIVLTTTCADFFDEGQEPEIFDVRGTGKKTGRYELKANQMMPRSTKVEIFTSQPIEYIKVKEKARLTIDRWATDSIDLDIDLDSNATLVVDTLLNPGSTSISMSDATLRLGHVRGGTLHIHAHRHSVVSEADVQVGHQWIHRGYQADTDISQTDSARQVYVRYRKVYDHGNTLYQLSLMGGFNASLPSLWPSSARYGSPYNTNMGFDLHLMLRPNDIRLNNHFALQLGFDFGYNVLWLDNTVKADSRRLVLDDSFGASNPRQTVTYLSFGLPIGISYRMPDWLQPVIKDAYLRLTPTFNLGQSLLTNRLDEDSHWHHSEDKLDILRSFNIRAAVGLSYNLFGFKAIEFYADLLPTYKASAGAPQTRAFGLNFIF